MDAGCKTNRIDSQYTVCFSGLVVRKGAWGFIVKERTGSISVGELGEK